MKCEIISINGSWSAVADACRETMGLENSGIEPTARWKRKILLAGHSPIRMMSIDARWTDLPYWVSVHFTRHKIGIEHFVKSQRSDRTGIERGELPQNTLVTHRFVANFQAVINISRKRLCNNASPETKLAWQLFIDLLIENEYELYSVCFPDCIYRGKCYEYKSCNFDKSGNFECLLEAYRE